MTVFMQPNHRLPCYLMFPRFLMDCDLNETSKLLYIVLLDRARLSMQGNGWVDQDGHVFITYPVKELAKALRKSDMTVKSALSALEQIGLIARKRQGAGQPNRIYVKLLTDEKRSIRTDSFLAASGKENLPMEGKKTIRVTERKLSTNNNKLERTTEQERLSNKIACGRYENVLLSPSEQDELKREIPNLDEYIERLSGYMASTGKTYQNHAATIRTWALRDKPRLSERRYDCEEGESL